MKNSALGLSESGSGTLSLIVEGGVLSSFRKHHRTCLQSLLTGDQSNGLVSVQYVVTTDH